MGSSVTIPHLFKSYALRGPLAGGGMRSLRLLIAGDHELFRAGLRSLLGGQPGWQIVAEASTGREAVAKAAKTHPDVTRWNR